MSSEKNLPLELLLIIIEYLELNDMISCSSISIYYRQILLPIVPFDKIVHGPNSKFSLSPLLKESNGNFLKIIGSKSF